MSTLTEQFLIWVCDGPRSYADAIDAWRSSCPRLTIWEDAIRDGLIRIDRAGDGTMKQARVRLTAKGEAVVKNAHTLAPSAAAIAGEAPRRQWRHGNKEPAPEFGGSRIPTPAHYPGLPANFVAGSGK